MVKCRVGGAVYCDLSSLPTTDGRADDVVRRDLSTPFVSINYDCQSRGRSDS